MCQCGWESLLTLFLKEESVEHPTTIAVDLAKSVFEVSISREPGRVCQRKRLTRGQFARFLALEPPATVLMEACGTAKISPVPVKTPAQQAIAALHRIRSGWLATRTARLNTIRGLLRELGIVIPQGARLVLPRLAEALSQESIPESLHTVLLSAASEIRQLEADIKEVERQLEELSKSLPACSSLRSIPGIGLLSSTALVASIGDPSRFKNGRRLASSLGVVPKEHSSGSSRHLGSITKRGDSYLRTLLTHGARSVLFAARHAKNPDPLKRWALCVQARRGHNRAAIALANKLARIAWAVWSKNTTYQPRPAKALS